MCCSQPSFYHTFVYIKEAIYLLMAIHISFWYSQDYSTVYLKNTFELLFSRPSQVIAEVLYHWASLVAQW